LPQGNEEIEMKTTIRLAAPLIAVALMGGAPLFAHAQNQPAATTENPSWQTPPPGSKDAQAAYTAGVQSALADKLANRAVDPKTSRLYVHPPVNKQSAETYRSNFTAGYEAAVKHSSTTSNGTL
jgi:hypothetical protein